MDTNGNKKQELSCAPFSKHVKHRSVDALYEEEEPEFIMYKPIAEESTPETPKQLDTEKSLAIDTGKVEDEDQDFESNLEQLLLA